MAFTLGDIIVDRIQIGFAEKFDGTPMYVLTQLQDATIDISAESKEATDRDGTLVKKFWQGKTGTFSATNAMLNFNILAATAGTDPIVATQAATVTMPKIITVKAGETATLTGVVSGTVRVNALANNGTMGDAFAQAQTASATEFGLSSSNVLTTPTAEGVTQYVVKYDRAVDNGISVINKADKFPGTCRLTLKVLAVDPCSADTLKAAYIVLPSFQVSPEVSISFTTDGTLDYTGDLQVDYCSTNKSLYEFYWAEEDDED